MKINHKQKELVDLIFNKVKDKFPEIELINISNSPEDPSDLWINVVFPEDENRARQLRKFASKICLKYFDKYGYLFDIMPDSKNSSHFYAKN